VFRIVLQGRRAMSRYLLALGLLASMAGAAAVTVGSPETQSMDPFCAS
jgi:hypothetical protein